MGAQAIPNFIVAVSLLPFAVAAQDAAASRPATPAKLTGTPFKEPIDALTRAFHDGAGKDGALVPGSARGTAMVLCAAGNGHRFYHAGDGPWVRRAIHFLFQHRKPTGLFHDANDADGVATTRWVIDALSVMHPQRYAEDVRTARDVLARKGANAGSAFGELAAKVAGEADPVAYGKTLAAQAAQGLLRREDGTPDHARSAQVLAELVALQCVARTGGAAPRPDGETAPQGASTFSPGQQRGMDFLMKQQKDGVVSVKAPQGEFPSVELTALGLAGLQTKPKDKRSDAERAAIEKGLAWLAAGQNKDGSFGQNNVNYTTSAVILALRSSGDASFAPAMERAQKYLLGIQHTEARDFSKEDRDYGSIGYGGSERGDLSNLQFALQALRDTGLPAEHEAMQKALVFLQRTQNLKETNDFNPGTTRNPDAEGGWEKMGVGDDGGAAYYPGNSPAGYLTLPDGTKVPRSYGSMTYALLKAYTLCGVGKEDPRVKAAVQWIGSNWTLAENPGADVKDPKVGEKGRYQGLFYYYMVLAQALDVAGIREVTTKDGTKVDWRKDLRAHLEKLQAEDGSWVNDKNDRWWENQKTLCTIYALLALQKC